MTKWYHAVLLWYMQLIILLLVVMDQRGIWHNGHFSIGTHTQFYCPGNKTATGTRKLGTRSHPYLVHTCLSSVGTRLPFNFCSYSPHQDK